MIRVKFAFLNLHAERRKAALPMPMLSSIDGVLTSDNGLMLLANVAAVFAESSLDAENF